MREAPNCSKWEDHLSEWNIVRVQSGTVFLHSWLSNDRKLRGCLLTGRKMVAGAAMHR